MEKYNIKNGTREELTIMTMNVRSLMKNKSALALVLKDEAPAIVCL